MSELVSLRNEGDVAVVTIDNPPVNALSHAMRSALVDALSRARADTSARAIVIVCAGRTFIAGADISEFGKPVRAPTTLDVIDAIEGSEKPVVAALHGTPLGGGLEVALACHYRVAAPGTRLGLPEIKLGLMPGAGGTQRLPRLVGMDKAMAMILSGDPISAAEARDAGLIDAVVEGDLDRRRGGIRARKAGAAARAGERARREARAVPRGHRSTSRPPRSSSARAAARRRQPRRGAARRAHRAGRRALARERALFLELVASERVESAAPRLLRRARSREDPGHRRDETAPRAISAPR